MNVQLFRNLGLFAEVNACNVERCNRPTIGIGRIGAAYEWVLGKRPGGTHTLFCQVSPKKVHNIGQSHAAPFTRCVHNV